MAIRDRLYGGIIYIYLWVMFVRKPNRLPDKTLYESNHWYFITICTHNRKCIFTTVPQNTVDYNNNNKYVAPDTVGHSYPVGHTDTIRHHEIYTLPLTPIGEIIESVRYQLPNMFGNIILDAFVIMPNHMHGIIWFDGTPYSLFTNKPTNLGNIIKRFKLETINQTKQHSHLVWSLPLRQKSFHDHIIRNQDELVRIQQYIINNPLQRNIDSLYNAGII